MAMKGGTSGALPGSILLVIHDFIARSQDELSLAKGDRIELIERDDDFGDGYVASNTTTTSTSRRSLTKLTRRRWFLGKHLTNGNNGLFPEVYTTPAPKGTLASAHKPRPSANMSTGAPTTGAAIRTSATPASTTASASASSTQRRSTSGSALPSPSLPIPTPLSPSGPARSFTVSSDSPVMSETLSVIDEHITDMRTPRSSYNNENKRDTVGSVYSTLPIVRQSYIAGHETDEEEQHAHTKDEVLTWSSTRVAEYLEDHGVERAHCSVFREQEISGDVLLAMDQNSLFIKEFDLGSVGRRLKTWHKIKALQDEINAAVNVPRNTSGYSTAGDAEESGAEPTRIRSSTTGAIQPRALTTSAKRSSADTSSRGSFPQAHPAPASAAAPAKYDGFGVSPLQNMTSMSRQDSTLRPSAQDIRNMNRSRRHSSIDADAADGPGGPHKREPSGERRWPLGQRSQGSSNHAHTTSSGSQYANRTSTIPSSNSPSEVDRGYFSSTEIDKRNNGRGALTKRNSAAVSSMHSRNGSAVTNYRNSVHSRGIGSADDLGQLVSAIVPTSQQSRTTSVLGNQLGTRSATSPQLLTSSAEATPPLVTKLHPSSTDPSLATTTSTMQEGSEKSSPAATSSPSSLSFGMFSSARAKVAGLRSISDAVTKGEKDKTVPPVEKVPATIKEGGLSSPTLTGASTPSTENRSLDISKPETTGTRSSTGSGGALMPPPPAGARRRARTTTKKATSAYTRGLEKKTPAEQMLTCDYSGWMKKKSGSLMTTWKSRLFILRGRRLSYYYRDDDVEEKGLIDISFHRVLPAQNETLTGLHATMTGATGSPTNPAFGSTPTIAQQDLRDHPPKNDDDDKGLFIFKLVPPKVGLAKGVNFTKPTVHYFAVNSRQEGRLWMAALMKATIDRDHDGVVTTTYNQPTISLAKARARQERPPALKDDVKDASLVPAELPADAGSETGLGIVGGVYEKDASSTIPGAEKPRSEDASSLFASTIHTNDASSIWTRDEALVPPSVILASDPPLPPT